MKCSNLNNGCSWVGELSYLEEHVSSRSCNYTRLISENKDKNNNETQLFQNNPEDRSTNAQRKLVQPQKQGEKEKQTTSYLTLAVLISILAIFLGALSLPIDSPISMKLFPSSTLMWNTLNNTLTNVTNNQLHLQTNTEQLKEMINELASKSEESFNRLKIQTKLSTTEIDELIETNAEQLREMINELAIENEESFNRLKIQTKLSTTIIKLNNFHQHKIDNDFINSPPFYTSPRGYKLRTHVYANDNGDGKDTHVSVYACLMKGEYDDTLTWPFLGTVIIELLNQLEDKSHHKGIINFTENKMASQRVVKGEGGKVGWGISHFISHTSLGYDPLHNCQYLKDDSLVFRITAFNYKYWLHE